MSSPRWPIGRPMYGLLARNKYGGTPAGVLTTSTARAGGRRSGLLRNECTSRPVVAAFAPAFSAASTLLRSSCRAHMYPAPPAPASAATPTTAPPPSNRFLRERSPCSPTASGAGLRVTFPVVNAVSLAARHRRDGHQVIRYAT